MCYAIACYARQSKRVRACCDARRGVDRKQCCAICCCNGGRRENAGGAGRQSSQRERHVILRSIKRVDRDGIAGVCPGIHSLRSRRRKAREIGRSACGKEESLRIGRHHVKETVGVKTRNRRDRFGRRRQIHRKRPIAAAEQNGVRDKQIQVSVFICIGGEQRLARRFKARGRQRS